MLHQEGKIPQHCLWSSGPSSLRFTLWYLIQGEVVGLVRSALLIPWSKMVGWVLSRSTRQQDVKLGSLGRIRFWELQGLFLGREPMPLGAGCRQDITFLLRNYLIWAAGSRSWRRHWWWLHLCSGIYQDFRLFVRISMVLGTMDNPPFVLVFKKSTVF